MGSRVCSKSMPFRIFEPLLKSGHWRCRIYGRLVSIGRFAKAEIHSASDLERLYLESLEQTSIVESLPVRVIRFMLTAGIGLTHPAAGLAVGVIDSFFVARFLKGYRPKLMFDELSKLFPEDRDRKVSGAH
jgi:hypothetical protein